MLYLIGYEIVEVFGSGWLRLRDTSLWLWLMGSLDFLFWWIGELDLNLDFDGFWLAVMSMELVDGLSLRLGWWNWDWWGLIVIVEMLIQRQNDIFWFEQGWILTGRAETHGWFGCFYWRPVQWKRSILHLLKWGIRIKSAASVELME